MSVKIEFETCTAAFAGGCGREEIARILEEVADSVRREVTPDGGTIRDVNGNSIGSWRFVLDGGDGNFTSETGRVL